MYFQQLPYSPGQGRIPAASTIEKPGTLAGGQFQSFRKKLLFTIGRIIH
jgi:hypothetical protein